jgi:hypothetical protein
MIENEQGRNGVVLPFSSFLEKIFYQIDLSLTLRSYE